MPTWAKGTTRTVLLTASFVALGASTVFTTGAYADTTSGTGSVLGGNQVNLPISIPIDVSGNAVAAAGHANAGSQGGASVTNRGSGGGQRTSGKHSVGGGNQISAPISAPINACGNAIAIFGSADAGCKGGASVKNSGVGGGNKTSGKSSVLGGNQVTAPISVPINACGNAVAIFGNADAGCEGGAEVTNKGGGAGKATGGTNGDHSVGGGNQVYAPVSAPVNVCGNAAAIFGDAVAGCEGGAKVKNTGGNGAGQKTSGRSGVLAGNQVNAPVSAPVDVCGNAVGNASAGCEGGASVRNEGSGHNRTSGKSGVLSGNQVNAPVGVPVEVCGNAVALLGNASAECQGGAKVHNTGSGSGNTTSGKYGVGSGNQVFAPVSAPVNVCGNAVAVLGDAGAGCVGGAMVGGSGSGGNTTSGKHGVGSGNQVIAPVSAPIDVCGNVGSVVGSVDPSCGDGSSVGGGDNSCRTHQDAPAGLGLPVLPTATGLAGALPVTPGSALPTMPQLPVQPPAGLPMPTSAPAGTSLSGVTTRLPARSSLPAVPQAAEPNKLHQALPVPPAVPGGLTGMAGALPTGQLPAQLPQTSRSAQRAAETTPSLPGLPALPGVGALPVGGKANVPQVGGVTDNLGRMHLMAAVQPASSNVFGSALYVLTIGALLGAASVVMAATRRIRRSAR